jgi:8-oxo-dGTP pyrophosphatase MutT (NUDIX family)
MIAPEIIRQLLAGHPVQTLSQGELQAAAVLLPLFIRNGEYHVLFTRRTDHLRHHQGEISFPGGSRHAQDADLLFTALRETEEEMGILPGDVTVLGRLDDFISVHGYHVVPYVGMFPSPYSFRINPQEIAEVIEISVTRLCDPAIFRQEDWNHKGRHLPVFFYTVGDHQIWGLTAAILRQFLGRIGATDL